MADKYQESMTATHPISGSDFGVTIFGDSSDDVFKARCCINVWHSAGQLGINLTPADAKRLAAHLALAAEVAESGGAEVIDLTGGERVAA